MSQVLFDCLSHAMRRKCRKRMPMMKTIQTTMRQQKTISAMALAIVSPNCLKLSVSRSALNAKQIIFHWLTVDTFPFLHFITVAIYWRHSLSSTEVLTHHSDLDLPAVSELISCTRDSAVSTVATPQAARASSWTTVAPIPCTRVKVMRKSWMIAYHFYCICLTPLENCTKCGHTSSRLCGCLP